MRRTTHTFLLVGGNHTHRLLRTEAQMWTERVKLHRQNAGTLERQKYSLNWNPGPSALQVFVFWGGFIASSKRKGGCHQVPLQLRTTVQLFSKCTGDIIEPLQMRVVSATWATCHGHSYCVLGWAGQPGRAHRAGSVFKAFFLSALAVESPWTCFDVHQLTIAWWTHAIPSAERDLVLFSVGCHVSPTCKFNAINTETREMLSAPWILAE